MGNHKQFSPTERLRRRNTLTWSERKKITYQRTLNQVQSGVIPITHLKVRHIWLLRFSFAKIIFSDVFTRPFTDSRVNRNNNQKMLLPFTPLSLTFENVKYSVDIPKVIIVA